MSRHRVAKPGDIYGLEGKAVMLVTDRNDECLSGLTSPPWEVLVARWHHRYSISGVLHNRKAPATVLDR